MVRDYFVEQGQRQAGIDAKLYARIPYLPAGSQLADDYLADLQVVYELRGKAARRC